jgi:hypothetical protein
MHYQWIQNGLKPNLNKVGFMTMITWIVMTFEFLHLGLNIDSKAPSWWIQYGLNSNMNKADLIITWKDYSLYMDWKNLTLWVLD